MLCYKCHDIVVFGNNLFVYKKGVRMQNQKFFKNKYLFVAGIVLSLALLAQPVFAASSYNWSFSIPYWASIVKVDGKKNGVLYHLTKGTLTVSGKIYRDNRTAVTYPVDVAVYQQKTLWFDSKVCSQKVTATTSGQYFSKNCGTVSEGTYYMVFTGSSWEDNSLWGNGTIKVP